jgi:hypothetical protein
MSVTEEARVEMLKLMDGKMSDSYLIDEAFETIAKKYDDREFAMKILFSLDQNHDKLINAKITTDFYHKEIIKSVNSVNNTNILTPEGKDLIK